MKRWRITQSIMAVAVLGLLVSVSWAETGANISGQQRLMAERAATIDAYRKLAERVRGLQIESGTSVGDMVTESDRIATELNGEIKGARIVDVRSYSDGSAEVDVELTIQQIVKRMQRIEDEVYERGGWKKESIENISRTTQRKVLSVTGSGAARVNSQIPDPADETVLAPGRSTRRTRQLDLPPIFSEYPPAERLKAKRAAELDAYRQLAERIYGLEIDSKTSVGDFVLNDDRIRTRTEASLKGVRLGDVRYAPDGVVEVEAEITIQQVVKVIKRVHEEVYEGGKWTKDHFDQITKRTNRKVLSVLGQGAIDTGGSSGNRQTRGDAGLVTEVEEVIIVD